MKSLIKPLFISIFSLLSLNLGTFWLFDLTFAALAALTVSALLAFALAFGFFYNSNTAPLRKIINLVHCRLAGEALNESSCGKQDLQELLDSPDPMVQTWDVDGDGELSAEELATMRAEVRERIRSGEPMGGCHRDGGEEPPEGDAPVDA